MGPDGEATGYPKVIGATMKFAGGPVGIFTNGAETSGNLLQHFELVGTEGRASVENFVGRAVFRPNEGPACVQEPPGIGDMIRRSVMALLVIIILICLVVYVLKKLFGIKTVVGGAAESNVLGRIYLDPRTSIFVVKIVDRIMIVGVAQNSIQLLSEITESAEMARIENALESAPGFASMFVPAVKRSLRRKDRREPLDKGLEEIRSQTERLKKLAGEDDDSAE